MIFTPTKRTLNLQHIALNITFIAYIVCNELALVGKEIMCLFQIKETVGKNAKGTPGFHEKFQMLQKVNLD